MAKSSGRLVSLDIFRGITIAFMIIVITPGSSKYVYPLLQHSLWNGCTPADLLFPFFLFIAGLSTYYSLKKFGNEITGSSILRIIRRMLAIFAVGLFLNIFPYFRMDYSDLRIMGVLQRIALAYGLGAIICLSVRREYLWIVVALLLLAYWGLLAFFGGADPYSLQQNFVLKTDLSFLGKSHLYTGFGIPFEPEGLLSTIPSICSVIIGYFIGEIVGSGSASGKSVLKLMLLAAAAAGLGYLWNMVFPFNEPLWTSSFVLFTSGLAMAVFAFIYLIADVFKFQIWGIFFLIFGMNSIVVFFLLEIWTKFLLFIQIPSGLVKISAYQWFYDKVCVPVAGNLNGSLMFAIIQMILIWLVALLLYRKKILIRL
jgi:predicted acyltransferase